MLNYEELIEKLTDEKFEVYQAQLFLEQQVEVLKEVLEKLEVLSDDELVYEKPSETIFKYRGLHYNTLIPCCKTVRKALQMTELKIGVVLKKIIEVEKHVSELRKNSERQGGNNFPT